MKSFPPFRLDTINYRLWRAEERITLPPKTFDVLRYLVEHPGRLITPDEILEALWPETHVNPEVLRKYIKEIRKALCDSVDRPAFIETVPKRGYQFIASVSDESTPPAAEPLTDIPTRAGERLSLPILRRSFWKAAIFVALLLLAVLIAGRSYLRPVRAARLTDKDTIVVGDFDNKTGDAVFDDTLKQGLSVQLEQSPFLSLISPSKVNQTLKLMGRSAGDPLTQQVTQEVCQRTSSKAMLNGSIVPLGSQYVIGLKAVNCSTGDMLAEAQGQAADKEGVLKALDMAATSLRGKLGESLSSVQKYDAPLEDATTTSLEALKAYSLGRKTHLAKGQTAALPFYQRALELDPNFATVYITLSIAYHNLHEADRSAEYARKAYRLREKVSERERFRIEAFYYSNATGELEKAAQTYELWQQNYPRDIGATSASLGSIYAQLGNWDKSLEEHSEGLQLQPNTEMAYVNLGGDYVGQNRLDEAEALYRQAEERKLEGEKLLGSRYILAFLKKDTAGMAQISSAAVGKPGLEDVLLDAQADTESWYGRLKKARELSERAMDSARRYDAKETAASYQAEGALREVEFGCREQARADAYAAMKLLPGLDVRTMSAIVLARAGDTAGAERLATELDKAFPLDTLVQRYWLPTIRAAVTLERKDPARAVELLKQDSSMDLSVASSFVILAPIYMRGQAYLALHDGKRAAEEFQKFILYRGAVGNFPWGAVARLGLARSYALTAQPARDADAATARTKARAAYQDFLTLWKDADPDVPVLKQAKAEYARLN